MPSEIRCEGCKSRSPLKRWTNFYSKKLEDNPSPRTLKGPRECFWLRRSCTTGSLNDQRFPLLSPSPPPLLGLLQGSTVRIQYVAYRQFFLYSPLVGRRAGLITHRFRFHDFLRLRLFCVAKSFSPVPRVILFVFPTGRPKGVFNYPVFG